MKKFVKPDIKIVYFETEGVMTAGGLIKESTGSEYVDNITEEGKVTVPSVNMANIK